MSEYIAEDQNLIQSAMAQALEESQQLSSSLNNEIQKVSEFKVNLVSTEANPPLDQIDKENLQVIEQAHQVLDNFQSNGFYLADTPNYVPDFYHNQQFAKDYDLYSIATNVVPLNKQQFASEDLFASVFSIGNQNAESLHSDEESIRSQPIDQIVQIGQNFVNQDDVVSSVNNLKSKSDQSDLIADQMTIWMKFLCRGFSQFNDLTNRTGMIIPKIDWDSYVTIQSQNGLISPFLNKKSASQTICLRLQSLPGSNFANFLPKRFQLFYLNQYMSEFKEDQENFPKIGLSLRYQNQVIIYIRAAYLCQQQKQQGKQSTSPIFAYFAPVFVKQLLDNFKICKLNEHFKLTFTIDKNQQELYKNVLCYDQEEIQIDYSICNIIEKSIKDLQTRIKNKIRDFNRFNDAYLEFRNLIFKEIDLNKQKQCSMINVLSEAEPFQSIYQSKIVFDKQEVQDAIDYDEMLVKTMQLLEQEQASWKRQLPIYVDSMYQTTGIWPFVYKDSRYNINMCWKTSNIKDFQINTDLSLVIIDVINQFEQFRLKQLQISAAQKRDQLTERVVKSDFFMSAFRNSYNATFTEMYDNIQCQIGSSLQKKGIVVSSLKSKFFQAYSTFVKDVNMLSFDQRPTVYDQFYCYPKFAMLPLLLMFHSAKVTFQKYDQRCMKSILIIGKTTVGKSFHQEMFLELFQGQKYNLQTGQNATQFHNSDCYQCSTYAIDEIQPSHFFTDYMKNFTDCGQVFKVSVKNQESVNLPTERQVIITSNMELCNTIVVSGNRRAQEQFISESVDPMLQRCFVIWVQNPAISVQQQRSSQQSPDDYVILDSNKLSFLISSPQQADINVLKQSKKMLFYVIMFLTCDDPTLFIDTIEKRLFMKYAIESFEKTLFGKVVRCYFSVIITLIQNLDGIHWSTNKKLKDYPYQHHDLQFNYLFNNSIFHVFNKNWLLINPHYTFMDQQSKKSVDERISDYQSYLSKMLIFYEQAGYSLNANSNVFYQQRINLLF